MARLDPLTLLNTLIKTQLQDSEYWNIDKTYSNNSRINVLELLKLSLQTN